MHCDIKRVWMSIWCSQIHAQGVGVGGEGSETALGEQPCSGKLAAGAAPSYQDDQPLE